MPGRQSSPEIVGRSREMERLSGALERAATGRGSAVIVAGEAGVGKTRLLTEFVAGGCSGATVLVGACLALAEEAPPFWPVLDALRALGQRGDVVARRGAGAGSEEVGGEGSQSAAPRDAGTLARDEVFEPVLATLEQATELGPAVLVIEDLHWSDRSTRDLLTFLVGNLRDHPFLLIGSYRSDALVPDHPLQGWLAELVRSAGTEILELERLSRAEMGEQLAGILGGPPRPEIVEAIWTRSAGNAFFAEELLAAMVAGEEELPPTIRQVLLGRIASRRRDATRLLAMVAVAGSPVRHELLAALGELPAAELLAAVRECVDHQLLLVDARSGGYAFRHALLGEAVDGRLLPAERSALHRACAEALSANPALAYGSAEAALAWHWFAAGDHTRALPAAIAAADAAEAAFGFAEACTHLERALAILEGDAGVLAVGEPVPDRIALRLRAAECANLAGDHTRAAALARTAATELATAGRSQDAALAWERLGRYLWDGGASEDALGAYERAAELAASGGPGTTVQARVVAAQAGALMLAGRYADSHARATEALDIARRSVARREEAQVLAVLGFDLAYLGDPGGVELLLDARHIAEEDADWDGVARAYVHLATLLSEPLNRLEEAVAVAEDGLARVQALGLAGLHGAALQALIVNTLFRLGRWEEGYRRVTEAFAASPSGAAAIDLHLARAKIALGRGDFSATVADLEAVTALASRAVDPRYTVPVLTLEAGLAMFEGRLDDARAAVGAGLEKLSASQEVWFAAPLAWHGLRAEADRAEAARARRRNEEIESARIRARELLDRLEHLSARLDPAATAVHRAAAVYSLMCTGEWSRLQGASSPETWEQVAATWDEMGQPYPAAYARWRVAEALLQRRARSAPAADALRWAHAAAVALGAAPLLRELEALGARAGIGFAGPAASPQVAPPTTTHAEPELGLTRRELEVLRLVAMGRTNKEVAATLFISEKTAGVHVSNILRKLDLRSRVEASAYAHRVGLLT